MNTDRSNFFVPSRRAGWKFFRPRRLSRHVPRCGTRTQCILILSLLLSTKPVIAQIAPHLVISEVYGGGGNSGSLYRNDFVELYNPTPNAVTLANWSIQYESASGNGSSWQKTVISGTVASHGFFLIQEAQGSGGSMPLPQPDAAGTMSLASTGGKIALANDTVKITGPSGGDVVDFVGYGSANQFEGAGPAGALSNTTSASRKARSSSTPASMANGGIDSLAGNGWDSGDNHADFVTVPTQGPQNSSSATEDPPPIGNLPPAISNVRRSLHVPDAGGSDSVLATITDAEGTIASVRLHVRVNRGQYDSSFIMRPVPGSGYGCVIPPSKNPANGALVEYFVSAIDDSSAYASSEAAVAGYFVGDASVSSVKSYVLASIPNYGARINGTINVRTNTFASGAGFIQDGTGGMGMFLSGGLPSLSAGRNARVEGSVSDFNGAYQLGAPGFTFKDTSLGFSPLTPVTVTLPLTESPANANEGELVAIHGVSTAATGVFAAGATYLFRTDAPDTIGARVESYAGLNSLVGTQIPSAHVDAVGILSFSNGTLRLKPRIASDMGNTPIVSFEAAATGNWSDTNTWSGHVVPLPSSDVTMTTPGVTVTIDVTDARCKNLTLTGSGTTLGPTLRFDSTGAPGLTVNGDLGISGGSGSGQGGRSKLTSNGNTGATLILKHSISTSSSNSTGSGNAGLNMNEGTVKLLGPTADTIRNNAGFRLGNLEIGNGLAAKTVVWSPGKKATLVVRGLTVRSNSTFLIGSSSDTNANDIGNAASSGVPTLTGGITVEQGASLLVQSPPAGAGRASINLDGGGVTNNGTMILSRVEETYLLRPNDGRAAQAFRSCTYALNIGEFPAGSSSSSQSVLGTGRSVWADIIVAANHTLAFQHGDSIPDPYTLLLNGSLVETPGQPIVGRIEATRFVPRMADQDFGGIGCVINSMGAAPESTTVIRVTGIASGGSIGRYFDIAAGVNSGLDATFDFFYDDAELNGQDPRTLRLWKSVSGGATWTAPAGTTVDTAAHRIRLTGVNSFSRWTASDAAHNLQNSTVQVQYKLAGSWNLISFPLSVADPRKVSLFPEAISPAFRYTDSYIVAESLRAGLGYWVKFSSARTDTITGTALSVDSIVVSDGWNLIGTPPYSVPKSQIIQIPDGIVASNYFGYNGGYMVAQTLEPTRAYWVKINGGGTLIFAPAGGIQPWRR
jgi:hypothetical protein